MEILPTSNRLAIPYSCNSERTIAQLQEEGVCVVEAIKCNGLRGREINAGVKIVRPCTLGTDKNKLGFCLLSEFPIIDESVIKKYGLVRKED